MWRSQIIRPAKFGTRTRFAHKDCETTTEPTPHEVAGRDQRVKREAEELLAARKVARAVALEKEQLTQESDERAHRALFAASERVRLRLLASGIDVTARGEGTVQQQ